MIFANFWRWLSLLAYFGLIATILVRTLWLAPPQYIPIVLVLVFHIGPLLLPLRGMVYGRPYTHAWTSLLTLYYFAIAVYLFVDTDQMQLALLEIVFCVLLFTATLAYVRNSRETTH